MNSNLKKPNIVLITCHDIGQHIGCYGVETVQTPCIDAFAAEGIRLENNFCTAPQCSPSRASIYTGRYPHNNGVMGLTHFNFAWDLYPNEKHLASILKQNGYQSALIGIQHETRHPENIGFDLLKVAGVDASSGEKDTAAGYGEPVCEKVAKDAVEYIEDNRESEKPFYLQVGFFEPHRKFDFGGAVADSEKGVFVPPYLVDNQSATDEFAAFQGAIKKVDSAIGEIFKAIDATGIGDDTIVIYTADHGIPFPRAKCTLYDAGLQVPFIIRWNKRGWNGGKVLKPMISNIDYLPTLLEALNIDIPENIQGRSFTALLDGKEYQPNKQIFAELTYHDYYNPMRCVRTDKYKLIANFSTAPSFMNPSQSYYPATITTHPEDPAYEYHDHLQLFDLENDPNEFDNLADKPEYQSIKKELSEQLLNWMKQTKDPLLEGAVVSPHHNKTMSKLKDCV